MLGVRFINSLQSIAQGVQLTLYGFVVLSVVASRCFSISGSTSGNKSTAIRPGKVDLLFHISHLLNICVGGWSIFNTSKCYLCLTNHSKWGCLASFPGSPLASRKNRKGGGEPGISLHVIPWHDCH